MKNLNGLKLMPTFKSITIFTLLLLPLIFLLTNSNSSTLIAQNHGCEDIKTYAFMGVETKGISDATREALDFEEPGIMITKIVKGEAAKKAGLKEGDILIEMDGKSIFDSNRLSKLIKKHNPGETVALKYMRKGKTKTMDLTLGERVEKSSGNFFFGKNFPTKIKIDRPSVYIGIKLQDLEGQLGEYFGAQDGKGVLITEVIEDSPAEKSKLKSGDVVVKIAGEKIKDAGDISKTLRDRKDGETVEVIVIRNGKEKTIEVNLEAPPEDWGSIEDVDFDIQHFNHEMHNLHTDLHGLNVDLSGLNFDNLLLDNLENLDDLEDVDITVEKSDDGEVVKIMIKTQDEEEEIFLNE
jgi:membrane-associated protease RseP (regulator of RpoE activity)